MRSGSSSLGIARSRASHSTVRRGELLAAARMDDYDAIPRWMRKAHFFDLGRWTGELWEDVKEWETFTHYLKSDREPVRVPFLSPDLPLGFVPRSFGGTTGQAAPDDADDFSRGISIRLQSPILPGSLHYQTHHSVVRETARLLIIARSDASIRLLLSAEPRSSPGRIR